MSTMQSLTRSVTISKYCGANPVTLLSRGLGLTPASAAQQLKLSADKNPIMRVAEITRILRRGGRVDVSERLLTPIDVARLEGFPVPPWRELELMEQEIDGHEDESQVMLTLNPASHTWDTRRKKLIRYREIAALLIAAGDKEFGR